MKKIKRTVSIILSVLIITSLFTAIPITAQAVNSTEGLKWKRYGDSITITGFTETEGTKDFCKIPDEISGYPVTSIDIADYVDIYLSEEDYLNSNYSYDIPYRPKVIDIPDTVNSIYGLFDFTVCIRYLSIWEGSERYLTDDHRININGIKACVRKGSAADKDIRIDSRKYYRYSKSVNNANVTVYSTTVLQNFDSMIQDAEDEAIAIPEVADFVDSGNTLSAAFRITFPEENILADLCNINYTFQKDEVLFKVVDGKLEVPQTSYYDSYAASDGLFIVTKVYDPSDLEYTELDDGTYAVSGNNISYNTESVIIPKYHNAKRVTSIEKKAFYNCDMVKSIIIPDSVTNIGERAFASCVNLESITIPNSVTNIGESAFEYCIGLGSITIPNSVTNIGESVFNSCRSLESISIPDSVTAINKYTFENCASLKSVAIPEGVSIIGEDAFADCSSLESITIPHSVTEVCNYAFHGCSSLKSIEFNDNLQIDKLAFNGCSSLQTVIIGGSEANLYEVFEITDSVKNVIIKDGVTSIGDDAFKSFTGLESISIPDSVTSIGNRAFVMCTALSDITIPNSVTSIGDNVFGACSALSDVTISNSVTSIGDSMFYNCPSLSNITIPNSVTSIGSSAFALCSGLSSITIPDSVTSIKENAFFECTSLKDVILSQNIKNIDIQTFYDCTSLESITMPDALISIGEKAFYNCTALKNITIPDSLTNIDQNAFENCVSLESIIIPGGVNTISDSAFNNCVSLKSLMISEGVTRISNDAFDYCASLESIAIPYSVTIIGSRAFANCYNLKTVIIPNGDTEIYNGAFAQNKQELTIYGERGSKAEEYVRNSFYDKIKFVPFPHTLTDSETGISVSLTDDFERFKVEEVDEDAIQGVVLNNDEIVTKAYYIILTDGYFECQPQKEVEVKIPCSNDAAKVYRLDDDLSLTDVKAKYEDGFLVFKTNYLGTFLLSERDPAAAEMGDVNNDGKVNGADAGVLNRYAAGWKDYNIKIKNFDAADINKDGKVNGADAGILARYTSDWKNYDKYFY